MDYKITYNPKDQIIETTLRGSITLNDVKGIISEMARLARQHDCHLFLNDYRELLVRLSTIEIYSIPGLISDEADSQGLQARKFKRAIVAKNSKDLEFLETVTLNQGQVARLFQDMDAARHWLLED